MTAKAINHEIQKLANEFLNAISDKEIKQNKKVKNQVAFLKKYLGSFWVDEKKIKNYRSNLDQMKALFNFELQNAR